MNMPSPPSLPGDAPLPGPDGEPLVVEGQRFALVPEWVIEVEIADAAYRLYTLLLRYGGTTGARMPSRATLATRLHRSVDAVDRALRELTRSGLVRVEHRRAGQRNLSNRYYLRTTAPGTEATAAEHAGGRRSAATQDNGEFEAPTRAADGREGAATLGRRSADRVAADARPNPEQLTQNIPPPPALLIGPAQGGTEGVDSTLLGECGITDLSAFAARCTAARTSLGQPTARWSSPCLVAALKLAVRGRYWPAHLAAAALLAVAADKDSRSPMRLAEAGPWWDQSPAPTSNGDEQELAGLEERLTDLGGRRPALQAEARAELAAEGQPVTRTTVTRRAIEILDRRISA